MTEIIASLPRRVLPQIDKKDLPEFLRYLDRNNVKIGMKNIDVKSLKPIQKAVDKEKVQKIIKDKDNAFKTPIITTSDNLIVDGNHRWVAAMELGMKSIKCIICKCPIKQFLKLSHKFSKSYTKDMGESVYYNRNRS